MTTYIIDSSQISPERERQSDVIFFFQLLLVLSELLPSYSVIKIKKFSSDIFCPITLNFFSKYRRKCWTTSTTISTELNTLHKIFTLN